jgi:hypothetical protein
MKNEKRKFKTYRKHNQNPRQRRQKLDVLTVCTSFKFINTITGSNNNTYEQVNSSVIARQGW